MSHAAVYALRASRARILGNDMRVLLKNIMQGAIIAALFMSLSYGFGFWFAVGINQAGGLLKINIVQEHK